MRRSILDIAFVKEKHNADSDFHCPISRPYRAITVGAPRLKPGLSSQGPSGRYADNADNADTPFHLYRRSPNHQSQITSHFSQLTNPLPSLGKLFSDFFADG